MNIKYAPTPVDEATRLEGTPGNPQAIPPTSDTPITETATYAGAAFDTEASTGVPVATAAQGIGRPVAAVVNISAGLAIPNSNETYEFQLMESADMMNWNAIGPAVALTLAGNGLGIYSIPGFLSKRFVALALTLGGEAPSITYEAWLTTQGFPRI